jgi:hypothetical protein
LFRLQATFGFVAYRQKIAFAAIGNRALPSFHNDDVRTGCATFGGAIMMSADIRRGFFSVVGRTRFILACAEVLLVVTPHWVRAQPGVDEIGPDAFLEKYRQVMRESVNAYRDVEIEGTAWERVPIRESKDLPVQFAEKESSFFGYTSSDGCEELRFRTEKPEFRERVFILAEERGFALRRVKPGGPFSLQRRLDPAEMTRVAKDYRSLKKAPYCPPLCPTFPDFPAWVSSSDFRVRQVSRVTEGGQSVLKVLFDYRSEGARENQAEGWVCVDPSIGWVIRSFEIETRITGKSRKNEKIVTRFQHTGSMSYTQNNGRAVPAEIRYGYALNNSLSNTFRYSYKLSTFRLAPTERSRFTLAAFDLGDYEQTLGEVEKRATYRTTATVSVALLASLVLFWCGRRFHSRWKDAKASKAFGHTTGRSGAVEQQR